MPTIDLDTLLLVGVCGPPHGVHGELKVIPDTNDLDRLLDLERVWLGVSAEKASERKIVASRPHIGKRGPVVLMHFEGIVGRDAADTLRKQRVYALRDDLPPLEEDEMYIHDLQGLEVVLEGENGELTPVGVVSDVIEGVAQDLLVVSRQDRPDALIPDVDEIVTEIDLDTGRITIRPPEGLLD